MEEKRHEQGRVDRTAEIRGREFPDDFGIKKRAGSRVSPFFWKNTKMCPILCWVRRSNRLPHRFRSILQNVDPSGCFATSMAR